ncbi:MAG: hypothetical protein ABII72_04910 [Parcubacteria group bacterium]
MRWLILISTLLLAIVILTAHLWFSEQTSLPLLFGYRNNAVLDFWSVHHFLAGIVIGRVALQKFKKPLLFVSAVLFVALTWEGLELLMEAGKMGLVVATWKEGFEHWGNRFIGDFLAVMLGGLVARRYHQLWKYALIYCLVWFTLNAAMPNSMYIQSVILER